MDAAGAELRPGRPVVDVAPSRVVDLLWRQQHDGVRTGSSAGRCLQCERHGSAVSGSSPITMRSSVPNA